MLCAIGIVIAIFGVGAVLFPVAEAVGVIIEIDFVNVGAVIEAFATADTDAIVVPDEATGGATEAVAFATIVIAIDGVGEVTCPVAIETEATEIFMTGSLTFAEAIAGGAISVSEIVNVGALAIAVAFATEVIEPVQFIHIMLHSYFFKLH